ncbi:hypothetical protein FBZ84_12219 [Azospirillum baldaniorum]|nr:hypothetical protein FBZ84_12219 [Azospirillum baldaniorum]
MKDRPVPVTKAEAAASPQMKDLKGDGDHEGGLIGEGALDGDVDHADAPQLAVAQQRQQVAARAAQAGRLGVAGRPTGKVAKHHRRHRNGQRKAGGQNPPCSGIAERVDQRHRDARPDQELPGQMGAAVPAGLAGAHPADLFEEDGVERHEPQRHEEADGRRATQQKGRSRHRRNQGVGHPGQRASQHEQPPRAVMVHQEADGDAHHQGARHLPGHQQAELLGVGAQGDGVKRRGDLRHPDAGSHQHGQHGEDDKETVGAQPAVQGDGVHGGSCLAGWDRSGAATGQPPAW